MLLGIKSKMICYQILAKRGPDSRFVLEANLKSLCPKSSWSSILKTQNRVETMHEYLVSNRACLYKSAKLEARIVKPESESFESNITQVEL